MSPSCILTFYELDTSRFQIPDVPDDVVRSECNMLNASASVIFHVLFYLRLLLSMSWLVDRHLHDIIRRRHHYGL